MSKKVYPLLPPIRVPIGTRFLYSTLEVFRHHLDELMYEMSQTLQGEIEAHKRDLVFEARKLNNSAAIPIACSNGEIYALRTRFVRTVERYMTALEERGVEIDTSVENEMKQRFAALTAAPSSLHFPPALVVSNIAAVQSEYSRELQRVSNQLCRAAANKLREAKFKARRISNIVTPTVVNIIQMPYSQGRVYNHSTDNLTTNVAISSVTLRDIDRLSAGVAQLEQVARKLRQASPNKKTMAEVWNSELCPISANWMLWTP